MLHDAAEPVRVTWSCLGCWFGFFLIVYIFLKLEIVIFLLGSYLITFATLKLPQDTAIPAVNKISFVVKIKEISAITIRTGAWPLDHNRHRSPHDLPCLLEGTCPQIHRTSNRLSYNFDWLIYNEISRGAIVK